jgi:cytochrome c551/c552
MKMAFILFLIGSSILVADGDKKESQKGEALFKEYCWGCHHQTVEAFGPSFKEIANKRSPELIMAQIADPKNTFKKLGYKRNSMPPFDDLNSTQLEILTKYILQFKDKK